jgi:hypothetical protein
LQIGRPAQQCAGRSLVKVGGTYVARAIGQYRTKPPEWEGVETGWRASLVDEGTVRLSSKGESDRITQRSAVQIPPRNHERHARAVAFSRILVCDCARCCYFHRCNPFRDRELRARNKLKARGADGSLSPLKHPRKCLSNPLQCF